MTIGIYNMSMETPLVSISCITFNHAGFIRDALEGFLMQKTTFPFEILIHDDASSDGTADIIREYEKQYPGLIFPVYQTENQYSKGVRRLFARFIYPHARGKYIAFCEGDDYWTDPLKLQKQVDFLETNKEYVMCWTRFKVLEDISGKVTNDLNEKYFREEDERVEFDFAKFYQDWHIGMQTIVFRNKVYDTAYLAKYKYAKDIHLITELLLKGKGACLNFFGAVYRKHAGGIYSGTSELANSKLGYLCYKEIFQNNRSEHYLKLKYIKFGKNYIRSLLKNKKYASGLKKAFEISFAERNYIYFVQILGKIIIEYITR